MGTTREPFRRPRVKVTGCRGRVGSRDSFRSGKRVGIDQHEWAGFRGGTKGGRGVRALV